VAGTIIITGFFLPVVTAADRFLPARSVLVIEEPDVCAQRGAAGQLANSVSVRELVEWEYQVPGAADSFYHRYHDAPVIAVIPATEYSVPFAARLAERFGVPGATLGAAEILRDKSLLRVVSAAAGITNPASMAVQDPEGVRQFAERYPGKLIIKPSNRQAAVGTWIINDVSEIDAAWAGALDQDEGSHVPKRGLPTRMLVEQHIAGPEFSVEVLVQDGVCRFSNVTGKALFPGPRPVEMGHVVPADVPATLSDALVASTDRVVAAVGFQTGMLHCEWILGPGDTPFLVECAGRMPGDWIVDLIEHAWPIDIANRYFTVMRGDQPEPPPEHAASVAAVWFLDSVAGVVESVDGLDEARRVPDVIAVESFVAPGDVTYDMRSSWDRVAMAMAWAATHEDALESAKTAISKIRVKVRPVQSA